MTPPVSLFYLKGFAFQSILFFSLSLSLPAQTLFHQDIFHGGVTMGGFSTGQGSGSGEIELFIEPGSTIRNAYLFSYRAGNSPTIPFTINEDQHYFDTLNKIMDVIHANHFFSPISLYYKNITNDLNENLTDSFAVTIPFQPGLPINWGWFIVIIYIEYEHPDLPKTSTSLWVNDQDLLCFEEYSFTGMNPMDTSYPVGLSLFLDRACNDLNDGSGVWLNGNVSLGLIGRPDSANGFPSLCSGTKGHFYYQNQILFGLNDDTPDNIMGGKDALADISSYLENGATGYDLLLDHIKIDPHPAACNINLLFANAYTTPCDTFSTSIMADTVICQGDSIPLFAGGGTGYSWLPATGLSNPNIANPMAAPDSTTLYVVKIENTPGCTRTEKVLVKVNEIPTVVNELHITEEICGNEDGIIAVEAGGNAPFIYSLGDDFQSGNTFGNLNNGDYLLSIKDNNGCVLDTVLTVPEVNTVSAAFTASPETGTKPLHVDFINSSANANHFQWYLEEDLFSGSFHFDHIFDSAGIYTAMLVAYNNIPECADTMRVQIIVDENLIGQVPNIFTPNGDGINDRFAIDVQSANTITIRIFNRWGNAMHSFSKNLNGIPEKLIVWDGSTPAGDAAPDGVYFYTLELTGLQGKMYRYNGEIHLLR